MDRDTVTLTLTSAVWAGDTVTVGYTPPSAGKLRAGVAGGAAVAAFSGQAVTNVTQSAQPMRLPKEVGVLPPDNGQPAQPNAPEESPPGDPGQPEVPDNEPDPDAPITHTGTNGRDDIPGGDGGDLIVLKTEGGSWPAVADIIANMVTQGSQYYVYTLSAGLTVETDTPLRAEDFTTE